MPLPDHQMAYRIAPATAKKRMAFPGDRKNRLSLAPACVAKITKEATTIIINSVPVAVLCVIKIDSFQSRKEPEGDILISDSPLRADVFEGVGQSFCFSG